MYGTQAVLSPATRIPWFENDVKMYGTQAYPEKVLANYCLRMM